MVVEGNASRPSSPSAGRFHGTLRINADDYDSYLLRLSKLIPPEALGLYLVGSGTLVQSHAPRLAYDVLLAAAVILAIVVRIKTTSLTSPRHSPQWGAIIVASISLLIYVYALPNGIPDSADSSKIVLCWPFPPAWKINYVGSLLVLVWTAFVPFLYNPKPSTPK